MQELVLYGKKINFDFDEEKIQNLIKSDKEDLSYNFY